MKVSDRFWNKSCMKNTYTNASLRRGHTFSLLFVLLFVGCHCPSPMGFCAHDLGYMLMGIPFLLPLKLKLQNFHWWRHKECEHHPNGEICKAHDHLLSDISEEDELQRLWNRIYEEEIPESRDPLKEAFERI